MSEPEPDQVERGLAAFTADRYSPERLSAAVAAAIEQHPDQERVGRMLRRGASVLTRSRSDGHVELIWPTRTTPSC